MKGKGYRVSGLGYRKKMEVKKIGSSEARSVPQHSIT